MWFDKLSFFDLEPGGGNVMCVCLYQQSVCQFTVPKVCTVGLYST